MEASISAHSEGMAQNSLRDYFNEIVLAILEMFPIEVQVVIRVYHIIELISIHLMPRPVTRLTCWSLSSPFRLVYKVSS